jgi:hypothetical protein
MPSLPPCEVVAFTPGARAHGTDLTVVGSPRGTDALGDIVSRRIPPPDNSVADEIDDIDVLLLLSSIFWGEHDESDDAYMAVGPGEPHCSLADEHDHIGALVQPPRPTA